MADLREIPVSLIKQNPSALRAVDRDTEEYKGLVDSVRTRGVMNAIVVRPVTDEVSGETTYAVIDGLHRYTAACDAGLETIPSNILPMNEIETLEAQIIGNLQRVETKPVEYARQLQRILSFNPTLTASGLAARLCKSSSWINNHLGLQKLAPTIAQLVDEGNINLSNAFVLSKLPPEEQPNYVEQAMTMTPTEFGPIVQNRKNEITKARREGRDTSPAELVVPQHMRKLSEVKEEFASTSVGKAMLQQYNVQTPLEAWQLAFKWLLHQDPASVEAIRAKHEARQKERQEKADRAQRERLDEKEKRARIKADRVAVEAAAVKNGDNVDAALKVFDAQYGLVDGKFPAKETVAAE